jgi:hypothetical protein
MFCHVLHNIGFHVMGKLGRANLFCGAAGAESTVKKQTKLPPI